MNYFYKVCFSLFCLLAVIQTSATDYYIDAVSGDDSNNGTSLSTPWETITNINTTIFQPGDQILFKAGQSWTGTIKPQGSGIPGNPIKISKYGTGPNPIINGDGMTNCTVEPGQTMYCTILLYNQEYWEIRDLEITNYDSSEEGGKSLSQWESDNFTDYVQPTEPNKYTGTNSKKCGILVEANNEGQLDYLHFINLEIHGVNGLISTKHNGGIFIRVFNFGTDIPTYFNDLLIEDCYIHDVDRTGISNWSDYDNRTLTTNTDWTPNTNFVIRNTTFERTGANALIVRVSDNTLIEGCHFNYCSIKESGNAAFNFNTDGTVWQYNEFEHTKANVDDHDAGGVDSDFRSKNTTIQYNYLHDNDFGMLVTGGPPGRFNDSTVVRYNIFEREGVIARFGTDGKFVLRTSGSATNTIYHNNVIYLDGAQSDTKIAFHKGWSGSFPDNTRYFNNVFYNEASGSTYEFTSSTDNLFSYNIYYGNSASNEPTDINKITGNPLFNNPGGGENGYTIQMGSSALGKGIRLGSTPSEDYYGNDILLVTPVDMGVEQVSTEANVITVDEDAHIRAGSYASTNYGSEELLVIKGTSNANFRRETLFKFDLSGYVYNTVASAVLYVYGDAEQIMDIGVYELSSDGWSEGSVTWNNAPSFSNNVGRFTASTSKQWYQLDITDAVQAALSSDETLSLGLKDDAELVQNVNFFSKENAQLSFHPYLLLREGVKIEASKDAYVRGGIYNSTNYGSDTLLIVKDSPTNDSYTRKTYINFDVSNIVGEIESAVLHFSGNMYIGNALDVNVYETLDSWTEGGINWNNAPSSTGTIGTIVGMGSSFTEHQMDITDFVLDEANGDGEVSLLLRDDSETNDKFDIRSLDSGINPPYVKIVYQSGTGSLTVPEFPTDGVERSYETVLYPNPVSNNELQIMSPVALREIKIVNIMGQEVLKKWVDRSKRIALDVSRLSTGLYMVYTKDVNGKEATMKVIRN